jgi:hypothetical protein
MKRITAAILLMLTASAALFAQPQEKQEKIEAMKVAFITTKLDLTPQEAQVFWPVYNEYENKMEDIRKKRRKDLESAKETLDAMSDKEIEALVDNEMAMRQKELDIQKEYNTRFKAVLPVRKVAKLYAAEEQFKRELLKMMKEGKQGPPPQGKGPKRQ